MQSHVLNSLYRTFNREPTDGTDPISVGADVPDVPCPIVENLTTAPHLPLAHHDHWTGEGLGPNY